MEEEKPSFVRQLLYEIADAKKWPHKKVDPTIEMFPSLTIKFNLLDLKTT